MHATAMGLGDITVHSYLEQPFNADISLIDVGNTPLTDIQIRLASPDDYKRLGFEQPLDLTTLTFTIQQQVIHVSTRQPMTEPYIQLVLDLAWAKGQVYRVYTILLDPPNYQQALRTQPIASSTAAQKGVVHKTMISEVVHESNIADNRPSVNYGPTQPNETIWQIAQRYKATSLTIQQLILAIVGHNPELFEEGNLNGLLSGVTLRIPSTSTAKKVPLDLAALEVRAHDNAWQSKRPIVHELLPPYINAKAATADTSGVPLGISVLPSIHALQHLPSSVSKLLLQQSVVLSQQTKKPAVDLVAVAIASVREANGVLREQLQLMQQEQKRVLEQLAKRDARIEQLQKTIRALKQQQAVASQASALPLEPHDSHGWFWGLLCLSLLAGVGLAGYSHWFKPAAASNDAIDSPPDLTAIKSIKALDALLGLARAYMRAGKIDLAKESLQDVLKHGTPDQQAEATRLLDKVDR